jgi:hypothetical protein
MINNQLTPAGFNFLGGLYESAVDRGLNVVEVQDYLRSRGIHKALAAIKHDLEHTFAFAGYVQAHPAPRILTYAEIDAQLGKTRTIRAVPDRSILAPAQQDRQTLAA